MRLAGRDSVPGKDQGYVIELLIRAEPLDSLDVNDLFVNSAQSVAGRLLAPHP